MFGSAVERVSTFVRSSFAGFEAMTRLFVTALFLTSLSMNANATANAQEPASADTFEREALKTLKAAHAAKKSVVLHVGGQTIAGAVKAIGPDAVVIGNREHANIIVRRERIDVVEAD